MAVLTYTVCFLKGLKSLNNKLLANNKSLPAGQFSLGRIRARLIRSTGTQCTEATALLYSESSHHLSHATHTPWWEPLQEQRCSFCLVRGSGNVTGRSSEGISSERNLWGVRGENCWQKPQTREANKKTHLLNHGWIKDVMQLLGAKHQAGWLVNKILCKNDRTALSLSDLHLSSE